MQTRLGWCVLVAMLALAACGDDDVVGSDSGTTPRDGGSRDGAAPGIDAAGTDAAGIDAGTVVGTDAGPPSDAGPACTVAYVGDRIAHAPPTTGPYALYPSGGTFAPSEPGFLARGASFEDPVFHTMVRRLTDDYPMPAGNDIYAKNGWWNADGTRFMHRNRDDHYILDSATGAVLATGIPVGYSAAEMSFSPVDPDVYYIPNGTTIDQYVISTRTRTTVKDFGMSVDGLGGSLDWIDASGRYFLVNLAGNLRIYDRESDTLYAGSVPATFEEGWAAISPDGAYVVTAENDSSHKSYRIDHTAHTLGTSPTMFWNLCGDHGDLVSASDGKTYLVTFECYDEAAVYAVDVSLAQDPMDQAAQRASNRNLFDTDWADSGHFSGVSRGPLRDWAFASIESGDDTFGTAPSGFRPFESEIVMANVLTGEVRRLAHHRSRSVGDSYYYAPRLSASWDGTHVAWSSNFGVATTDYSDVYVVDVCP